MPVFDPEEPAEARSPIPRATRAIADPTFADRRYVGGSPSFFDAFDAPTLVACVVASVACTLVELDATRHPEPLDALDLALRMVALASIVRAGAHVLRAILRFTRLRRERGSAIVLLDDHLVVLGPREAVLDRGTIVGAATGIAGDGRGRLFVLLRDARKGPLLELPVGGGVDADAVARRIERYVVEGRPPEPRRIPPAPRDPGATFDRVVAHAGPGELAIAPSYAFLERGPYAASAFVVILLERIVRGGATFPTSAPVVGLVGFCVLLPLAWVALGLRRVRAMGGAAIVLTSSELLSKTSHGIHRAPWDDVQETRVRARRIWTLVSGTTTEKSLVVARGGGNDITFDARLLALPVEVVASLVDAYRTGVIDPSPASQGSGGGTGISAATGTST